MEIKHVISGKKIHYLKGFLMGKRGGKKGLVQILSGPVWVDKLRRSPSNTVSSAKKTLV